MSGYIDDDPISSALQNRRIPNSRSGHGARRRKTSGRKAFDPLRAVGAYNVQVGSVNEGEADHQAEDKRGSSKKSKLSSLTIHGFAQGEEGLLASIEIGGLMSGMGVLAGSKKGVEKIVSDLERQELTRKWSYRENDVEDDSENEDDEANDGVLKSPIEEEDEKINRRARAFEKNSFRNPKFWMQWKGHVRDKKEEISETNSAYLVFSGNDCVSFEGTISCEVLQWDNVAIKGRKIKPHVGECPVQWADFD